MTGNAIAFRPVWNAEKNGTTHGVVPAAACHLASAHGQMHITPGQTRRRTSARVQGVAKNFKEIFEQLAPGGHGQLVMLKRGLADMEPDADDDVPAAPTSASERYKGVKVKVSLTMILYKTVSSAGSGTVISQRRRPPPSVTRTSRSRCGCFKLQTETLLWSSACKRLQAGPWLMHRIMLHRPAGCNGNISKPGGDVTLPLRVELY